MIVSVTAARMPSASIFGLRAASSRSSTNTSTKSRYSSATPTADTRMSQTLHHTRRRPLQRPSADDRRHRRHRSPRLPQRLANSRHRQNRPDADDRIRRAKDDAGRIADRPQQSRRRSGRTSRLRNPPRASCRARAGGRSKSESRSRRRRVRTIVRTGSSDIGASVARSPQAAPSSRVTCDSVAPSRSRAVR